MVYRFKPSDKNHEIREKKPYRRAGADSLRRLYGYRVDRVDLESLFEMRKLQGDVKKGAFKLFVLNFARLLKSAGKRLGVIFAHIGRAAKRVGKKLGASILLIYTWISGVIKKRRAERKEVKDLALFCGALSAVVLVCFVSVFAVLYKLVFSNYFGSYEKIIVPDIVGKSYSEARAMLDEEYYNITVSYEYSISSPAGSVISQYPSGGAERKIFSGGSFPTLSIVVSRGKEMIELKDLVGKRARDAALELKNSALSVITVEEFSDSVPEGNVILTKPAAGEMLEPGGFGVVCVSRGQEKIMLTVPDVCYLTEAEAIAEVIASGFTVGKIDYKSSSVNAGVVISQGSQAHTKLEQGSEISFTVSAGRSFSDRTVPSLYGLTLDEAREKLAEVGLVMGKVYATGDSSKKGRVIAQSPSAGSTLSQSLVSVDIYVG